MSAGSNLTGTARPELRSRFRIEEIDFLDFLFGGKLLFELLVLELAAVVGAWASFGDEREANKDG